MGKWDVGQIGLHKGQDRIKVLQKDVGGGGAGRNNGSTKAVMLVDFRWKIETSFAGLWLGEGINDSSKIIDWCLSNRVIVKG